MHRLGSIHIFNKIAAALIVLGCCCAARADISVDARLSRSATTLSDPVQLQIKITGAQRVGEHPDVSADGLAIRYVGPAENSVLRMDKSGMHSESTVIFVYEVRGEQHGTFTIPSLKVSADGQKFTTQPVALTIQQKPPTPEDTTQKAQVTAEFEVKKKTLYLGETVPAELRLYVDARIRGQVAEMPSVTADGLSMQKMPDPRQSEVTVTKDGRECNVVVFKTAITPSKAGKISLGPAEIVFNAQIPQARRNGSSLFDIFDRGMGGDPFFSQTQQVKIKAPPVELTVKPLPVAGRPADFSGAVGAFDLSAEGNPKRVNVGDPLTMKIAVSGVGNFDRVTAPAIKDSAGWRTYPPSSTFASEPDLGMKGEDVGIRGTKTFEMAVIPEVEKREMPVFEFSYFDPASGKYVTKVSQPAALIVEGSATVPAPVANAGPAASTPAAEKKPVAPTDILGLRYETGLPPQSFEPLYLQRQFLLAQAVPLLGLLGFLGWRLRPSPNERAHRVSALRRERSRLMAELNDKSLDHSEFFDHAARILQIDTALATGKEAASVDASAARASAPLDEDTSKVVDEIFKTRAELLYAGGNGGGGSVPDAQRNRILAALGRSGRSHGKH